MSILNILVATALPINWINPVAGGVVLIPNPFKNSKSPRLNAHAGLYISPLTITIPELPVLI